MRIRTVMILCLLATTAQAQSVIVGSGASETIGDGARITVAALGVEVQSGGSLSLVGSSSTAQAAFLGTTAGIPITVQSGGVIDLKFAKLEGLSTLTIASGTPSGKVLRIHDTMFSDLAGMNPGATPWIDLSALGSGDRAKLPFSFNRVTFSDPQGTPTRLNVKAGANTPILRLLGNSTAHGNRWGENYDDDTSNRVFFHTGAVSRSGGGTGGPFDTLEDAIACADLTDTSVLTVNLGPTAFIDDYIDWNRNASSSASGPTVLNACLGALGGRAVVEDTDDGDSARGKLVNCVIVRGIVSETYADNCTFFGPVDFVTLNNVTGRNVLFGGQGGGNTFTTSITNAAAWYFSAASYSSPEYDFHLVTPGGDAAIDEGATLTQAADFDGDTRGTDGKTGGSGTWDIGADEIVSIPQNFAGTASSSTSIVWSWSAASGATSYEIHDSSHAVIGTSTASTFEEKSLSENVSYSRHVHAVGGGAKGGASNADTKYTKVHDALIGDFTALVTSSTQVEITVTQPPNPTAGQTACEIQRTSDNVDWTVVKQFTTSGYVVTDTIESVPNSGYRYRVRYRNGDGVVSGESPLREVARPVLLSPISGSATNDTTPDFDWEDYPAKSPFTYQIQVDNDSDFSSPVINVSGLTASSYTPGTALGENLYHWRVIVSTGQYSFSRTFRVDTTNPAAPTLVSPANGGYARPVQPVLDWSDVTDTSGVTYSLQVDDDPAFGSTLLTTPKIQGSQYQLSQTLAGGTTWYWRVSTQDLAGNSSGYCTAWSFTVDATAPSAPTLLTPTDNAAVSTGTPAFDWSDVTDASGITYRIQVDADSGFASPNIDVAGLAASTYTPTSALPEGSYAWRVYAVDGVGNETVSTTWRFTVEIATPPAAPTINLNRARKTKDTTPLIDGSGPASMTIRIYFGTQLDGTTTSDGAGVWSYSATFKSDATYTVTAKSWNGSQESAASNSISLTVDTVCNPPINVTATPVGGRIRLEWTASPDSDVIGYEVYRKLSTEPDTSYTKIHSNYVVSTEYCDSTVTNGLTYNYRVKAVDDTLQEGP